MPHSFCSRLLPVLFCLALLTRAGGRPRSSTTPTPLQEVDPDVGARTHDDSDDSVYEDEEPRRPRRRRSAARQGRVRTRKRRSPRPRPRCRTDLKKPATPAAPTATPTPAPGTPEGTPAVRLRRTATPTPPSHPSDASASARRCWRRASRTRICWRCGSAGRQARQTGRRAGGGEGAQALLKLRDEVSASDFDAFSVSLLRESAGEATAKDICQARCTLAEAAVALSPNLPVRALRAGGCVRAPAAWARWATTWARCRRASPRW